METVIDIISENIPQIEAIELSDNKLERLDGFKRLSEKAPNVKILFLSDNKVRSYCVYFI